MILVVNQGNHYRFQFPSTSNCQLVKPVNPHDKKSKRWTVRMISFFALLAFGFTGLIVFNFMMQDRMIFYPAPVDTHIREQLAAVAFAYRVTDTASHNPLMLRGWLHLEATSKQRPLVIYYGGNGEEVSWNVWGFQQLVTKSFLLMNYRGYGDSEGKPGEQALYRDALALYDYIVTEHGVPPEHIVLIGRSLGSGIATYVARHRPVGGLVLVTPFDSLVAVGKKHMPYLPVGLLLKHRFDSVQRAPQINRPALAILAGKDQIVPPEHGHRLMDVWGGVSQTLTLPAAGHNDIAGFPEYWQAINNFFEQLVETPVNAKQND